MAEPFSEPHWKMPGSIGLASPLGCSAGGSSQVARQLLVNRKDLYEIQPGVADLYLADMVPVKLLHQATRYTGCVRGLGETFAKTPVMAQWETREPLPDSFLAARTAPPETTAADAARDACAAPEAHGPRTHHDNLWPKMQTTARQDRVKASASNISLGDARLHSHSTSYRADFGAPLAAAANPRSPLRNRDLEDMKDLRHVYQSAFNRVGTERLSAMTEAMREQLAGKVGNANNNAFKLRKLFKMYDSTGSGRIDIEDFRVMTESVGMQLDDDSLLALFSQSVHKQLNDDSFTMH